VEIIAVDPLDPEQVHAWHAVHLRSQTEGRAYATPWREAEVAVELRNPGRRRRLLGFTGLVDGVVVASGAVSLPQLDNLNTAVVMVDVDPPARRRGYGAAMLAHLEELAAADGRTLLNCDTFYPYDAPPDGAGHPNADFATRHGYVFGLGDVHRRLEMPVDAGLLDRLAADAAPHHAAYRILGWRGRIPEEHLAEFARIDASLMSEAPAGEVEREPESPDADAMRDDDALRAAQGRTSYVTVAYDGDGTMVACTRIMVSGEEPGRCYQWGTVVDPRHRGHRLGVAVKVANLRQVQQHEPGLREQFTYNAEVNAHMVAINEALGFVPVARLGEFQKRLGRP
jgi:GNAT superfamily N-acetyltransferase